MAPHGPIESPVLINATIKRTIKFRAKRKITDRNRRIGIIDKNIKLAAGILFDFLEEAEKRAKGKGRACVSVNKSERLYNIQPGFSAKSLFLLIVKEKDKE